MTPVSIFFTLFLSIVFFSRICDSRSLAHSHASSNLKQFEGYRKGHQGLLPIKTYLNRYGYLDSLDHLNHDHIFDDELESAILTYQQNFHLNTTGILDSETLSLMMTPRCGCPDIINGTNTMARRDSNSNSRSNSSFDTSLYTLYEPIIKWNKTLLYLRITDTIPQEQADWVGKGITEWANKTKFVFLILISVDFREDIRIEKFSGDHHDGYPFDGPGGVMAHSSGPLDGRIHFDADETWTDGATHNMLDMPSVTAHEMGHTLGLRHSDVKDAVMWPFFEFNEVGKVPQQDDLDGIEALYPGIIR